jgi:hypothetical protein
MRKTASIIKSAVFSALLLLGSAGPIHASTIQLDNAVPVTSGADSTGQISNKADVNIYKFTTDKEGSVFISLVNVTAPVQAQLVDSNGNQVGFFVTYFSQDKSTEVKVPQGTYYLKVSSYEWKNSVNSATYSLRVNYGSNASNSNNQTQDNAVLLPPGNTYLGKLASGADVNYYKIYSYQDGELYARIEQSSSPVSVSLVDGNGNNVTNVNTSNGKNVALDAMIHSGVYYIKVDQTGLGNTYSNVSYSLSAAVASRNFSHDQNFEPNDTSDLAYRIQSGINYTKTLTSNVDRDYYKFIMDHDGQMSVDFSRIENPIMAKLLDSNGNVLGTLYPKSLDQYSLKKGTYFIQVTPLSWSDSEKGSYTFNAAFPDSQDISVKVNGAALSFDQPPVIENGRTLVPLRGIMNSLGATIQWDGDTSKVTAIKNNLKVELTIGAQDAIINGQSKGMDVPAEIINGRTMVPLRFLSEALNENVAWDQENRTVTIQDTQASKPVATLPTITQNNVTVSITRKSSSDSELKIGVTIKNASDAPLTIKGVKVNKTDSGQTTSAGISIGDNSGFVDKTLMNVIGPGTTLSGNITLPVGIDSLTDSYDVILQINDQTFDLPLPIS